MKEKSNDPAQSVAHYGDAKKLNIGLYRAFDFFNQKLWEGKLNTPVITTVWNANRSLGWFGVAIYQNRHGAEYANEIALNPRHFFNRPLIEALSTLVHEMAHLAQKQLGKPPRGKYHDKAWGAIMKSVGLYPSNTGAIGGKETGDQMSHYIMENGAFENAAKALISQGFDFCLGFTPLPISTTVEKPPKTKTRSKYQCPDCGMNAWAKPHQTDKLVCGLCKTNLEEQ